jgi:hypothetical protein
MGQLKKYKPEIIVELRRRIAEITTKWAAKQAEQAAIDKPLLDAMNAEAARLRALIPVYCIEVTVKKTGDLDGDPILEYTADGIQINWGDAEVIGWASATRPGALGSFASICVAYISQKRLREIKTAQATAKEAKELAKEAMEKGLKEALIPQRAIDAYNQYHGDADEAWEDENETAWAMIREWAPYIEAQHGINKTKLHKEISEASREVNFGINEG